MKSFLATISNTNHNNKGDNDSNIPSYDQIWKDDNYDDTNAISSSDDDSTISSSSSSSSTLEDEEEIDEEVEDDGIDIDEAEVEDDDEDDDDDDEEDDYSLTSTTSTTSANSTLLTILSNIKKYHDGNNNVISNNSVMNDNCHNVNGNINNSNGDINDLTIKNNINDHDDNQKMDTNNVTTDTSNNNNNKQKKNDEEVNNTDNRTNNKSNNNNNSNNRMNNSIPNTSRITSTTTTVSSSSMIDDTTTDNNNIINHISSNNNNNNNIIHDGDTILSTIPHQQQQQQQNQPPNNRTNLNINSSSSLNVTLNHNQQSSSRPNNYLFTNNSTNPNFNENEQPLSRSNYPQPPSLSPSQQIILPHQQPSSLLFSPQIIQQSNNNNNNNNGNNNSNNNNNNNLDNPLHNRQIQRHHQQIPLQHEQIQRRRHPQPQQRHQEVVNDAAERGIVIIPNIHTVITAIQSHPYSASSELLKVAASELVPPIRANINWNNVISELPQYPGYEVGDPCGFVLLTGVLRMMPPSCVVEAVITRFERSFISFRPPNNIHPSIQESISTSFRKPTATKNHSESASPCVEMDPFFIACQYASDECVYVVLRKTLKARRKAGRTWSMLAYLGDARVQTRHAKMLLDNEVQGAIDDPEHGAFGVSPLDRMMCGKFIHGSIDEWSEKLGLALIAAECGGITNHDGDNSNSDNNKVVVMLQEDDIIAKTIAANTTNILKSCNDNQIDQTNSKEDDIIGEGMRKRQKVVALSSSASASMSLSTSISTSMPTSPLTASTLTSMAKLASLSPPLSQLQQQKRTQQQHTIIPSTTATINNNNNINQPTNHKQTIINNNNNNIIIFHPLHALLQRLASPTFTGMQFGRPTDTSFLKCIEAHTSHRSWDVFSYDKKNDLPLHTLLKIKCRTNLGGEGERKLVRTVMNKNREAINIEDGSHKKLPLRWATENGWPCIMSLVRFRKGGPKMKDKYGDAAIHTILNGTYDGGSRDHGHGGSRRCLGRCYHDNNNSTNNNNNINNNNNNKNDDNVHERSGRAKNVMGIAGARATIEGVLRLHPNGASVKNGKGRLPLHLALEYNWPVHDILIAAEPRALETRDVVSGFYPFMIAAACSLCCCSTPTTTTPATTNTTNTTTTTNNSNTSNTKKDQCYNNDNTNPPPQKNDNNNGNDLKRQERELNQLSVVYELIREAPLLSHGLLRGNTYALL